MGEFVYDATVPAMRASVTGVESGHVDLLITAEDSYRLTGPRDAPSSCISVGPVFKPPSRQWLSEPARCVGSGAVASRLLDWWTLPTENKTATWIWYRSDTRLPWRTTRIKASADPAVIGRYAMANFTTFEPLARTNLGSLREFCRAGNPAPHASGAKTARDLMAQPAGRAEAANDPAKLIAGLDTRACTGLQPPHWPARFRMTAIMLSTDFGLGPYPTEVYYDWDNKAQLTRLHDPENPASPATLDGLLSEGSGYHIVRDGSAVASCERAYPGIVRRDWMTHDQCRCRGVVRNNPAFARNETVAIFSCPVEPSGVFWAAYGANGRPISFRSTAVTPAGLTFADYYRWKVKDLPRGVLDIPAACERAPPLERAMVSSFAAQCGGCHTAPEVP